MLFVRGRWVVERVWLFLSGSFVVQAQPHNKDNKTIHIYVMKNLVIYSSVTTELESPSTGVLHTVNQISCH